MTARRTLSPAARGVVLAVRAALRAGRVDLADTLETTERERDEARDALRRLKSRPDERRLPCDGDARAEAAMARDAADEADPAWWRGHDAAVRGMMTVVRRALTEPPRGAYGSEEAREVDASIRALRTKLDAARREGAEGMREALIVRFTQRVEYLHPWAEAEDDENGYHSGAWTEALNAVQFTRDMVLPLDAPGGAS